MDNMNARMKVPGQNVPEAVPVVAPVTEPLEPRQPAAPPPRRNHAVIPRLPKKRWWLVAVIAVAVLALALGVWKLAINGMAADGINRSEYQAVFLVSTSLPSNVYFGKLERLSDGYYKLSDVYYLRNQQSSTTQQDNTNITLTKMSTELHSPEDALILPREQVLYYQNMKADSKVVQAIKQDRQGN